MGAPLVVRLFDGPVGAYWVLYRTKPQSQAKRPFLRGTSYHSPGLFTISDGWGTLNHENHAFIITQALFSASAFPCLPLPGIAVK
jgi:hypothetical protein